ncbi:MAG: calcium/sodium antiporter [Oscillospiraceae bacterium]|nr:calcium/sodium antiporter [Oscillospiraceae bacterium]
MLLTIALLLLGFLLLVKGADFFVSGSSSAARRLRIPPVVIGLTIVAMGTSMPEASVSVTAALAGSNEIALSNVVGSNIFNLLAVAGSAALICPYPADRDIVRRDLPINTAITGLLIVLMLNSMLSRLDGAILVICMIVYLIVVVRAALRDRTSEDPAEDRAPLSIPLCALLIAGGLAMIVLGGDLVVDSACGIARVVGLSETIIGLTVVAIGTSLPELVTSVVAARKGESELALGNVIGSNLFNIMFILGTSAVLSPIAVIDAGIVDAVLLIVLTGATWLLCRARPVLDRKIGVLGLGLYVLYTIYILMR